MSKKACLIIFLVLTFALGSIFALLLKANPDFPNFLAPKIRTKLKATVPVAALCPVTVTFSGYIAVDRACTVKYRFVRSDGAHAPLKSLQFSAAGKKIVSASWTLGANYSGWQAIEILAPVRLKSENAVFTATCLPRPIISEVILACSQTPGEVEIHVRGSHFQGSRPRRLLMDNKELGIGSDDNLIVKWMSRSTVVFPGRVYNFAISEDGVVISNVFSTSFLMMIGGLNPPQAHPGDRIEIAGCGFGPRRRGVSLELRTRRSAYPFTRIESWSDMTIAARVPDRVPSGRYKIVILINGKIVSWIAPCLVQLGMSEFVVLQ